MREIEEEDAKVEEEAGDTDDEEVGACQLEHLGIGDNHLRDFGNFCTILISWHKDKIYVFPGSKEMF